MRARKILDCKRGKKKDRFESRKGWQGDWYGGIYNKRVMSSNMSSVRESKHTYEKGEPSLCRRMGHVRFEDWARPKKKCLRSKCEIWCLMAAVCACPVKKYIKINKISTQEHAFLFPYIPLYGLFRFVFSACNTIFSHDNEKTLGQ